MAVRLHSYSGTKVSTQWLAVLRAADHKRVRFSLNSGARSQAEQERLIRLKGCWSPSNTDGAACPWYRSNHVVSWRTGPSHALDVSTLDGGEQRLQNWLNSHRGVRVRGRATNTVPGEPWHLELNRLALRWLYFKYRRFV